MNEIRLTPDKLDTQDLLADILLFESKWEPTTEVQPTMAMVAKIVEQIQLSMVADDADQLQLGMNQLNDALDHFYLNMAFSSTTQSMPESLLNSLSYLINYHTGECLSMSILLSHVLNRLGFTCDIMVLNHEIMLQVKLDDNEAVVIDAISGEQFLEQNEIIENVLPGAEQAGNHVLDKMSIIQIYLTQQKLAFTDENHYDKALYCIELLIETTPDDPYQRRDRGFLLHQLDCFSLARNDFEFFIDQCPEDPAAQLLKMQLEDFDGAEHTVH
jgi:regulator of sirC expression with transglutaminase-like and TPR domain